MNKREAVVESLRKKAEAAGELESFEHLMAAVAAHELRAEAGELDADELALETLLDQSKRGEDRAVELARHIVHQLAREPRCTCEDLIAELDRVGKCISSSCEQHRWKLVNRLEKRNKKDKILQKTLKRETAKDLVLKWYAVDDHYHERRRPGVILDAEILLDGGSRARAALEGQ